MKIDLLSIINNEGGKIPFDGEVFFTEPDVKVHAKVHGVAVNFNGELSVKADVDAEIGTACARCLKDVQPLLKLKIEEIIGKDEFALDGTILDVAEIVRCNILLEISPKYLCSEDCKGLCPVCGANLNIESCKCNLDKVDERFAVLKDLLKDNE